MTNHSSNVLEYILTWISFMVLINIKGGLLICCLGGDHPSASQLACSGEDFSNKVASPLSSVYNQSNMDKVIIARFQEVDICVKKALMPGEEVAGVDLENLEPLLNSGPVGPFHVAQGLEVGGEFGKFDGEGVELAAGLTRRESGARRVKQRKSPTNGFIHLGAAGAIWQLELVVESSERSWLELRLLSGAGARPILA